MNNKHPILVLVRGIPGSGKSYLASNLQAALAQKFGQKKVINIDPDATDYDSKEYLQMSQKLTADGVDLKFHPYRFIRAQAHDGIKAGQIIIWNQPFTQLDGFQKTIINLQAHASENDTNLPILVVEIVIDKQLARQRVEDRKKRGGHGPTEATFARFVKDYTSFAGKKYNTVVVNGADEVADSMQTIVQAIEKL